MRNHLLLAILFTLSICISAKAEVTGTFMVVKGEVSVVDNKTNESKPARVGSKVKQGDTIVSGKDARAKIVMADKNTINISPESKLSLDKYVYEPENDKKEVSLNVIYGKIRSSVEQKYDGEKNKFQVKTPTAVAGVRGTDFLTSFDRQTSTSQVVTFTGQVAVGLPGPNGQILNPVMVAPGQFTQTVAGKAPEQPKEMPKQMFAALGNESKAETAGNKDERAPASEQKTEKKEEPKKDKQDPAKGGRAPAAASGSMMTQGDLDAPKDVPTYNSGPEMPMSPMLPDKPPTFVVPETVNEVIRDQTTKANVRVNILAP